MVKKIAEKVNEQPRDHISKALANHPPESSEKKKKNRKRNKKTNKDVTTPAETTNAVKRKLPDDDDEVDKDSKAASKRQKIADIEGSDVVPELLESDQEEIEVQSLGSATSSDEDGDDEEEEDDEAAIDPLGLGGSLLEMMLSPTDLVQFAGYA